MRKFRYKLLMCDKMTWIDVDDKTDYGSKITVALNQFGEVGWRVHTAAVGFILLEREE